MDPSLLGYLSICITLLCLLLGMLIIISRSHAKKSKNLPPVVPGLPFIGNLLQLKEKKPHQTFTRWAELYGPIYSIKTGASQLVVLNSAEVAKEAMVTKFSSISTRKLSVALKLLTNNKAMVAMSDYGEFHKMVKRWGLMNILGAGALRRHRYHRDLMIENISRALNLKKQENPLQEVNLREIFTMELFSFSLKQAIGKDVDSIYVEELGAEISKNTMFEILVSDPLKGSIEIDWRDFFPYLRWIPNPKLVRRIQQLANRKMAVTRALIYDQMKRIAMGEVGDCYLDFLLSQDTSLTEEQLTSLTWEVIIQQTDTIVVTTEWAMYELARNPICQDRLYREICEICGSQNITEEHIPSLQYLTAIFHETLRLYSPVPILPLRYVHEDTQLGGYHIPRGTEIAINVYGCNMNKEDWEEPHKWKPERFLTGRYGSGDLHRTMSFGAGKRVCAGSLQAMLVSCVAIGRFVQEFEWKLKEGEEEKVDMVGLTSHKLLPMLAYIKPR